MLTYWKTVKLMFGVILLMLTVLSLAYSNVIPQLGRVFQHGFNQTSSISIKEIYRSIATSLSELHHRSSSFQQYSNNSAEALFEIPQWSLTYPRQPHYNSSNADIIDYPFITFQNGNLSDQCKTYKQQCPSKEEIFYVNNSYILHTSEPLEKVTERFNQLLECVNNNTQTEKNGSRTK